VAPQELSYLRRSKYCDTFVAAPPDFFESAPEDAGAILTEIARRCGATLAVGADPSGVRLLSAASAHTGVSCFPTPSRDVYDTLNNKWTFYLFCVQAGLPVPRTTLIEQFDVATIDRVFAEFPDRFIVKPLEGEGGQGVVCISRREELSRLILDNPGYPGGPWIAQEFIDGEDVDLSLLAVNEQVVLEATQRRIADTRVVEFIPCPQLTAMADRFVAASHYNGLAHIDARTDSRTGAVLLVECNPRPWASIANALFCGMDFFGYDFTAPSAPRRLESGRSITRHRPYRVRVLWAVSKMGPIRPSLHCLVAVMSDPLSLIWLAKRMLLACRRGYVWLVQGREAVERGPVEGL